MFNKLISGVLFGSFKTYAFLSLIAGLILYVLAGIVSIQPGEVGLLIKMIGPKETRGMQKETLDTGLSWIEPLTYDVTTYDTRAKQYSNSLVDMPSQTKDGQPITVDLSLEISLIDSFVPTLHETVGKDYYERIVYPAVRSAVRNATTKQLSDTIYTGAGRESVQQELQSFLSSKLESVGIQVVVNLRDIEFTNTTFVETLEQKAMAAQRVLIEERQAEAAEHTAIKMANLAEGEKQKRIKAAEADREERRLKGEGDRLEKEETAKGILAIAQAEAEGTRLQVQAYGSGGTYASVKWAEHLGPNVKVYGVPTGAPGTASVMDLSGVLGNAFSGMAAAK